MTARQGVNMVTKPCEAALDADDVGRGGVINANGNVAVAGAGVAPELIIDDIQATAGNGVPCQHVPSSISVTVTLGGTVAAGDLLTTDANGDFITGTSGDESCIRAEEGGAVNETIQAIVVPARALA